MVGGTSVNGDRLGPKGAVWTGGSHAEKIEAKASNVKYFIS